MKTGDKFEKNRKKRPAKDRIVANPGVRTKRSKKGGEGFLRRHALAVMAVCIFFMVFCVGILWFCISGYKGKSDVYIEVTETMSSDNLRDSLKKNLGGATGQRVYILWKLQGGNMKASEGLYRIVPGQSAFMAARIIAKGRRTPVRVTFNNVRTVDDLSRIISARMRFSAADFRKAVAKVLAEKGFKPEEFPAAFMPDTYEFYPDASPEKVIRKMYDARIKFWNEERMSKADKLGMTPVQVATLASIVEEESYRIPERPTIAGLYLNRLRKKMRLQADPTVKFAIGNPNLRRISTDMLKVESPYNTYRINGLPPGPIRIPNGKTIDAVLDAPHHSYLYMCAKSNFSGYHDFAETYEEHRKNAARYQAELDKRDIH